MPRQFAESVETQNRVNPEFEQLCNSAFSEGYRLAYSGQKLPREVEISGKLIRIVGSRFSPAQEFRAGFASGQADAAAGLPDRFAPAEPVTEVVFVDEDFGSYRVFQNSEFLGRVFQSCTTFRWSFSLPGGREAWGGYLTRDLATERLLKEQKHSKRVHDSANKAILARFFPQEVA